MSLSICYATTLQTLKIRLSEWAHADAYEDSLYVIEQIKKRIKVRDVINTTYDFCTGSHVGPESLAVFFMGKDRELEPDIRLPLYFTSFIHHTHIN